MISTTSSDEKTELLKKLGADHIFNYKSEKNWGEEAKKLTPGGEGVSHVIEVGGPNTMKQSLKAIKLEGEIAVIGFLGGVKGEDVPSTLDALTYQCTIKGFLVGSRELFEDLVRAVDANKIKPVIAEKTFEFNEVKEAYQYMWDQKHTGKVVIKVSGD